MSNNYNGRDGNGYQPLPLSDEKSEPLFSLTVRDGNWTGTFEEWQARGGKESARVSQLRERVAALEAMRPHWAKGYSDDSVAAHCSSAALSQLWQLLGVDNQTDAVRKLRAASVRFNKHGHEDGCNLMFPATMNTEDDHCNCSAANICRSNQ